MKYLREVAVKQQICCPTIAIIWLAWELKRKAQLEIANKFSKMQLHAVAENICWRYKLSFLLHALRRYLHFNSWGGLSLCDDNESGFKFKHFSMSEKLVLWVFEAKILGTDEGSFRSSDQKSQKSWNSENEQRSLTTSRSVYAYYIT